MRVFTLIIGAATSLLAACDQSPLSPDRTAPQAAAPSRTIIGGSGWTRVSLPFAPDGINDAGVIVGAQSGQAVRWQNGALAILPRIYGLAVGYEARAISPAGLIVGVADGHVLLWMSPGSTPRDIGGDVGTYGTPVAVNDNAMVVGYFNVNGRYYPWRWTPQTGIRYLTRGNYGAIVTGLNASGYVSGYVFNADGSRLPVRWDPSGNMRTLPIIEGAGDAFAINDRGDIAGNSEKVCVAGPATCLSIVMVWHADGTLQELFNLPVDYAAGLSNAGRLIGTGGWTYYNGVFTKLSYPDTRTLWLTGVNTCGSIVGMLAGGPDAGYLWQRGGITPTCDTAPLALGGAL